MTRIFLCNRANPHRWLAAWTQPDRLSEKTRSDALKFADAARGTIEAASGVTIAWRKM
jgi:hypothetical protein